MCAITVVGMATVVVMGDLVRGVHHLHVRGGRGLPERFGSEFDGLGLRSWPVQIDHEWCDDEQGEEGQADEIGNPEGIRLGI